MKVVVFVVIAVVGVMIAALVECAIVALRNADRDAYLDSRNPARWARKADTPPSDPPP